MGNSNTPGSVSDGLNPYHLDENAALLHNLRKRPPSGDPVPDWIKIHLNENELAQIDSKRLENQIKLEKQSTALKEQIFSHQIEQEKAATAVKEHALSLIKEKL